MAKKPGPSVRIVDKTVRPRAERSVPEKPPPEVENQQRPPKKKQSTEAQLLRHIGRRLDSIEEKIEPKGDYLLSRMLRHPNKYEDDVTDADFQARIRYTSKYYPAQGDYDEAPPKIHLSWKQTEVITRLRDYEVRDLQNKGYKVLRDHDNDPLTTLGRYIYSIEKSHRNLWLSIRLNDHFGYAWHYTVGHSPKQVNEEEKVTWVMLARVTKTVLPVWPELTNLSLAQILRESANYILTHEELLKVPRELRESQDFMADLYQMVEDTLENLQLSTELENELLASVVHLDPAVVAARGDKQ